MGKTNSGLSLMWVLFIVFLVLKLCHLINWSWVWIFSPIWIPLLLAGILLFLAWFLSSFGEYLENKRTIKQELANSEFASKDVFEEKQ